jgi:CheY-like chemotaxis protein
VNDEEYRMYGSMVPELIEAADRRFNKGVSFVEGRSAIPGDGPIRRKVLVVDDERLVADTISEILNENGFEAVAVYSAEAAIPLAGELEPDILLTDVLMPNVNGVQLAVALTQSRPLLQVILFSGQTGISDIIQNARAAGYKFDLLPKPIHPQELLRRLQEP